MLTFAKCEQLVARSRDKRSKPVDNNTRVERRDDDTYALRLHATDIATFHRDGRITVNSGGWRTVTTAERLDSWVFTRTRARYSDHGVWWVKTEPDPADPQPPRAWDVEKILKPFHALDPGAEPQKSAEGCVAGTEERREWDEEVLTTRREIDPTFGISEADIIRPYEHDSDYFVGYRIVRRRELRIFGEERYRYDLPSIGINGRVKYEQCPHCELFDRQHEAWELAMNGERWGRNSGKGYRQMTELLERFGSREAWQEAYLANFRERRAMNRAYKEWIKRNRVPFDDGMEIMANGYAKRPDRRAVERARKRERAIEKAKKRINKFVDGAVRELTTKGLPMPGPGDCWYCCMSHAPQLRERPAGAISMGDAMPTLHSDGRHTIQPSHEHLRDHMRERYYVPSMFVNALRDSGYKDAGIYMFLAMDPDNDRMGLPHGHHHVSEDTVTRALRKYLYKRLIPELAAGGGLTPLQTSVR